MPKPANKSEDVIVENLPAPSVLPASTVGISTKPLQMPDGMIQARSAPKEVDSRRKSYWIGTLPGGPYQNTDFGGQSFPAFSADVNETPDGTERFRRFGNVVRLLKEEVDGILLDVAGKVMQAGKIRCIASKHYRWDAGDEPAGCHVYMVEVPDGFQPPAFRPETMRHFNKMGEVVSSPWNGGPPPLVPRREGVAA